ncbi:MAG: hypothetical protein N5839_00745 [Lactobacillus iners]|nr:hypothetical protein [Lactobacillus iners]
MKFSSCSEPVQKSCKPKINNQGVFIASLFNAMGSKFFPKNTQTPRDYEIKILKGIRPITIDIKRSILSPFPIKEVTTFLYSHMQDDKIQDVASAFGFPSLIKPDKDFLAQAIARQYELIFTSDDSEVENIVWNEYQRIANDQEESDFSKYMPLYPGDAVNDYSNINWIEANTYEIIKVKFDIQNIGSVTWLNRKLVFIKEKTSCPIPRTECEINIPNIEPQQNFTKEIEIETRGSEGDFCCHFEMVDSNGNNCFPNRNIFDIRLRISFPS